MLKWFKSFFSGKALSLLLLPLAFVLASCTAYKDDYTGTWIGLDESGQNYIVYEYMFTDVATPGNENALSVRVIRKSYEFNPEKTILSWTETIPHYFPCVYDEDTGIVSTPFGPIEFEVKSGSLIYNNIHFTKKAKNTELKLKYVARDHLKTLYPEIPIND